MKLIFTLAALIGLSVSVYAQGVLISPNPGVPDSSAILELNDPTKGFLLTRMTTAQRNAIVNPATGLVIFNTTTQCIETFFNGGWGTVACECTTPPATPSGLNGPLDVCPNQAGVTYSIPPVPGAQAYTWTVPSGATITNGQGTNSITVSFGNSSGNISVTADNACGNSSVYATGINVANPNTGFSYNPAQPSQQVATTFNPVQTGQSYVWTFQGGNPSSSTAQNPVVTWNTGGTYTVKLVITNQAGCVDSSTQSVVVSNCLPFQNQTVNFSHTGAMQTWTVPPGVCSITIECRGAAGTGFSFTPGYGGMCRGTLAVSPGQTFNIFVGGQNGYNGGGQGLSGAWGGGASDVRFGGQTLNDRIIVAGGGGGAGGDSWGCNSASGHGGGGTAGPNYAGGAGGSGYSFCGQNGGVNGGTSSSGSHGGGGGGGGFTSGGAGATNTSYGTITAGSGTLGVGGNAVQNSCCTYVGGGGGGYYGGGGAAGGCCGGGRGGGGSSWTGTLTSPQFQAGVQTGNGAVIITY